MPAASQIQRREAFYDATVFDDFPQLTGRDLSREVQRELYGLDRDAPRGTGPRNIHAAAAGLRQLVDDELQQR